MKNIEHEYSCILMKTEEMKGKFKKNQGVHFQNYAYLRC